MSSCTATLRSKVIPGHVHTCSLAEHDQGDHMCGDPTCRRWYGLKGQR